MIVVAWEILAWNFVGYLVFASYHLFPHSPQKARLLLFIQWWGRIGPVGIFHPMIISYLVIRWNQFDSWVPILVAFLIQFCLLVEHIATDYNVRAMRKRVSQALRDPEAKGLGKGKDTDDTDDTDHPVDHRDHHLHPPRTAASDPANPDAEIQLARMRRSREKLGRGLRKLSAVIALTGGIRNSALDPVTLSTVRDAYVAQTTRLALRTSTRGTAYSTAYTRRSSVRSSRRSAESERNPHGNTTTGISPPLALRVTPVSTREGSSMRLKNSSNGSTPKGSLGARIATRLHNYFSSYFSDNAENEANMFLTDQENRFFAMYKDIVESGEGREQGTETETETRPITPIALVPITPRGTADPVLVSI